MQSDEIIEIPAGSYEIENLDAFSKNHHIELSCNKNTLHSYIKSDNVINFTKPRWPARSLGFVSRILKALRIHGSDFSVNISKVNTLRIDCSITTGAYVNQQKIHTIYNYFPAVPQLQEGEFSPFHAL